MVSCINARLAVKERKRIDLHKHCMEEMRYLADLLPVIYKED